MKKLGFTLAEIIVALSILGVVAAMTAPIINNIIPDKDKVQVFKSYKLITDTNKELLSDSSLYYKDKDKDGNARKGFNCTSPALRDKYSGNNLFQGPSKYLALFEDYMKTESSQITADSNQGSFITVDGVQWIFDGFNIHIDINEDGNDCSYNSNSCARPDRFIFNVDPENGAVSGGDPLTRAYLANPDNLSDKKADYKTAKNESNVQ